MTYQQLLSLLRQRKFLPIYLLVGEGFQRQQALSALVTAIVDPATKDFNLDVFYADEVDPSTLLETASSFPLMAERRVVVVKECDRLPLKTLKQLVDTVTGTGLSTSLILDAQKVDFRKEPLRQIRSKGWVVEFKPLYDNQIPGWIQNRVRERGKRMSEEAADLLHTSVGADLWALANEIDKLCLFVKQAPSITREDVEKVVGITKKNSIFELTDAIGNRQKDMALFILDRMLEAGESATHIIFMITRYLKTIIRARKGLEEHLPREQIRERTGIHSYFLERFLTQARGFSDARIRRGLKALLQADSNLKRSYQNPRLIMELLVYHLCE
ncbi:MAG: DNA polymerase III subunit delta [Candidatus Latescibacteria bacterium]|nr:DNA polymerase III subunit delta [Candidatus Latescibacterota bacterium]